MKYKRICARCGKETDVLYDNLCIDCYREVNKREVYLKKIKICSYCGSVFYKNKRVDYGNIKDLISDKTKIEYIVCNECKNKMNSKYNVIFQIRNLEKQDIEDLINILSKIGNIKNIKSVSENSIDIYVLVSKSKLLKKYLGHFKRKGFTVRVSKKLKKYDRQHSKPIYELTILMRK